MLLVNIEYIPGKEIEALGMVKGTVVQSKNFGKDFMAGMKTLVGGEITGYTEMLNEARQIAVKRMVDEAEAQVAPAGFTLVDAKGAQGLKYRLQVSTMDCTGCGSCAASCLAKDKALTISAPLLWDGVGDLADVWNDAPGRCHCSAAQHGGDVDACLGGVADVAGGEAQTGAVFLPAARPEKELEVVSGCLGPIPGCRSPGCAALFWRISPGF